MPAPTGSRANRRESHTSETQEVTEDYVEGVGPHRRCVLTRASGERARMLRFVVSPQGVMVADLAARLPGRGIWLSPIYDVIHSPRVGQAFSRAAKARVTVPDDLAAQVTAGLERRIGELIGLARRAGQAVAGFQKAREWLVSGRVGLVLEASDGSPAERERFLGGITGVEVCAPLSAARLGTVFGREAAVHVAVAKGRLADGLMIEMQRLAGVTGRTPVLQRVGARLPEEGSDNDD